MSELIMTAGDTEALASSESEIASPKARRRAWWDPASFVPTYVGILVSLVGFALLAIAWAQVAGETQVSGQLPYVMSAGLPGLGLIMTGLLVINIAAKRQDAAERRRQLSQLTEALRDLQRSIDGR